MRCLTGPFGLWLHTGQALSRIDSFEIVFEKERDVEMAKSVIDMMDQQAERANTPQSSGKVASTFLILGDKQKAIIRPVVNLDGAVVMAMHNRYHASDPSQSINAVCAAEVGKPCGACELAKADKKLKASATFMLPVYVYKIVYTKSGTTKKGVSFKAGQEVTYKDVDGVEKPVSGNRILKLTFFGRIASVAEAFKSRFKEGDNLTRRDFSLERIGDDTQTIYVLDPKDPQPKKLPAVTEARIRELVLEACPPMIAFGDDVVATEDTDVSASDLGEKHAPDF